MQKLSKPFHFVVTATTRPRRPEERHGRDYIFLDEEAFRRMIERGELLEWAEVYGHLYGVPRAQVAGALAEGRDVIVKPDVQGAATIKRLAPEALFIFLAPPNMEELARRLTARSTESSEDLTLRLQQAETEMREASKFDYVVTNHQDRLDDAVDEIERIVAQEKRRTPPRRVSL